MAGDGGSFLVNVILEFEIAHYEVTVYHINHYAMTRFISPKDITFFVKFHYG